MNHDSSVRRRWDSLVPGTVLRYINHRGEQYLGVLYSGGKRLAPSRHESHRELGMLWPLWDGRERSFTVITGCDETLDPDWWEILHEPS